MANIEAISNPTSKPAVLICGLGALGQACIHRLKPFAVLVCGMDLHPPLWRDEELASWMSNRLVIGDMRQPGVLRRAGVLGCRAVLLLSSDHSANLEAALQVRLLNPKAQVVVRASVAEAGLSVLLEQRLPGLAVVDPLLLTASAISGALDPGEKHTLLASSDEGERVTIGSAEHSVAHSSRRQLRHTFVAEASRDSSHANLWLQVETVGRFQRKTTSQPVDVWQAATRLWQSCQWPRSPQSWVALMLPVVLITGTLLFSGAGGWRQGLLVTFGLLLGEYVDPVTTSLRATPGSGWQIIAGLVFAVLGTLFTTALVAWFLEQSLSNRFGLRLRRRQRTGRRAAVIVDGGPMVEAIRQMWGRNGIELEEANLENGLAGLELRLQNINAAELVGIALLSSNLIANIHAALALQSQRPLCRIALLAHALEGSDQLGGMLGGISVISGMDIAADAIVATAFGERVERVLRIAGRNLLVVRYRLAEGDNLSSNTISRVENGYGINILCLKRSHRNITRSLPPLEWYLQPGDEITVLADLESLRLVERGEARLGGWKLQMRCDHGRKDGFLIQQILARFLGRAPGECAGWLDGQWHESDPLDHDLLVPLMEALKNARVEVRAIACT